MINVTLMQERAFEYSGVIIFLRVDSAEEVMLRSEDIQLEHFNEILYLGFVKRKPYKTVNIRN